MRHYFPPAIRTERWLGLSDVTVEKHRRRLLLDLPVGGAATEIHDDAGDRRLRPRRDAEVGGKGQARDAKSELVGEELTERNIVSVALNLPEREAALGEATR